MTQYYNKLVRDEMPAIIRNAGKEAVVKTVDKGECLRLLDLKLQEEVNEYQESKSLEELADICEVIRAIADEKGVTWDELEKIRQRKLDERGGFKKRIVLIEVRG
ncbi:MAG: nucleoside triphosphate pyrophosphohydrolase [Planctomycetia bacterium]|nr:nucleoside triphosphate pyrophosphohydrolase [Planctomycetia bacterium]